MSSKRQRKGLYVVMLLTLTLLIGGGCSQGQQAGTTTPEEVATTPEKVATTPEKVAAEIIPQEGDETSYGLPLSLNNTQQLVNYYNAIRLTSAQKSLMQDALLPLKAPCCDDKSMSTCCCPCNLAKSVWGLSSYLIVEKNYDTDQVRESALEWLHFIHNNYYIIQELKSRGVDPATYGLSHENPCYVGKCELPFMEGGCGGMGDLKL